MSVVSHAYTRVIAHVGENEVDERHASGGVCLRISSVDIVPCQLISEIVVELKP